MELSEYNVQESNVLNEKVLYEYELEIYRISKNGHPRSYLGPDPDHVLVMTQAQAEKDNE